MINYDVNAANAYVSYRVDVLAEHQVNLHRKDRKQGKISLKFWKKSIH